MAKDYSTMEDSNRSSNPDIHTVSDPARRVVLRGGLAGAALGLLAPMLPGCASTAGGTPRIGFKSVPATLADAVAVPEGYVATPFAPWGTPIGVAGNMPEFRPDAGNSAAEQAVQMGMHHDGIHYYAIDGSRHGLLAMNHEYIDDGLLHTDGYTTWSAEKVAKAQAAHGVSVIEVKLDGTGQWQMVRPSAYARRHTSATPFAVGGPAAGHALMRTAADPEGRRVLGTLNNCASGKTPWGTYLSGEENWANYFDGGDTINADQARWGLRKTSTNRWAAHDERFNAARHPNEFHRFGWVVEIDPMDRPPRRSSAPRSAAPHTRARGSA